MTTDHATLGGLQLPFNPDSVDWDFDVKVGVTNTIGGRVVQIYGTRLGDMTMSGHFRDWQQRARWMDQIRDWVDFQNRTKGTQPFRFVFPPRKWDFNVLIRALADPQGGEGVTESNDIIAPPYTLVLFVVQDNVGNIVAGIQDAYIARLLNGVGWKTGSPYNGPPVTDPNALATLAQDFAQAGAGTPPGVGTG